MEKRRIELDQLRLLGSSGGSISGGGGEKQAILTVAEVRYYRYWLLLVNLFYLLTILFKYFIKGTVFCRSFNIRGCYGGIAASCRGHFFSTDIGQRP